MSLACDLPLLYRHCAAPRGFLEDIHLLVRRLISFGRASVLASTFLVRSFLLRRCTALLSHWCYFGSLGNRNRVYEFTSPSVEVP